MIEFDVVVAGGGSAGVAAAIGSARAGARVLLLERGPVLGGAATLRNVVTYCGLFTAAGRQVVGGVADEIVRLLARRGAVSEPRRFTAISIVFDPEELKVVLDHVTAEPGISTWLHALVVGADSTDGRVVTVDVATRGGTARIVAKAFVDATGDADLASLADSAVRYGNEGKVQNGSLGVRFGGVPADITISRELFADALGRAGGTRQARLGHGGLIARMPISDDFITYVVDASYDARSVVDVSRAEASARHLAQDALTALRSLPGCGSAYIVTTGPELGTRESRHVVTRERLTEADLVSPSPTDDAVAVGAWPMEYHPGPGLPAQWRFVGDPGYYGIPLACLWSATHENLFVGGRAIDGDVWAGSSLRAMGTAFATGQAAGVAAALSASGRGPTPAGVRAELARQGSAVPAVEVATP